MRSNEVALEIMVMTAPLIVKSYFTVMKRKAVKRERRKRQGKIIVHEKPFVHVWGRND
jgi:hypothetical protein